MFGAVLATGGLVSTAYGVGAAATHGWTAATTAAGVGAGVALLVGFGLVEAKWARTPLIPMRLW